MKRFTFSMIRRLYSSTTLALAAACCAANACSAFACSPAMRLASASAACFFFSASASVRFFFSTSASRAFSSARFLVSAMACSLSLRSFSCFSFSAISGLIAGAGSGFGGGLTSTFGAGGGGSGFTSGAGGITSALGGATAGKSRHRSTTTAVSIRWCCQLTPNTRNTSNSTCIAKASPPAKTCSRDWNAVTVIQAAVI